jgi:archaemetzincin
MPGSLMIKNILVQVFLLFTFSVCLAMDFRPPGAAERIRAIGNTDGLTKAFRLALDPDGDFDPIPFPKPGDWLAEHPEPGQTFSQFVRSRPNRLDSLRIKLYLQPMGAFPEGRSPSLELLKTFAAAYFVMDAEVLPPLDLAGLAFRSRRNPYSGNRQILTVDILNFLRKRIARDAFCMLAITMEDLYPHPSWNFVFGQASLRHRVGVFSFARYDPAFYGERREKDYLRVLVRRSCKVLAHEMAHMFSLNHCIFFRCAMNGSNHLQESDSRPLHICPICLRKLQYSIGFDVVGRYERLLHFYQGSGFQDEAGWVQTRIKKMTSPR